jgi:raffinose/stachyose/melibiose transport system permease protein
MNMDANTVIKHEHKLDSSSKAMKSANKPFKSVKSIVVLVALCLFALIQLFPLFWLLTFSFKDNFEIFGGNVLGLPQVWRISNYITALTAGNVTIYFMNSVIVTICTIVIASLLICTTSYAIARMRWRFRGVALVYFLLGMMVPIHATLLPLFMVLKKMHLLNNYLSLILPYVAFAIPMGILIMTGFLESIPRELEEAACIDGCSIYKMFAKLILPLMRPAISTISIFIYMNSWNELMFANTFINGDRLKTLPVGIFSMVNENSTEWGPIGAGLVIATLPTIIMYIAFSEQVQNSLIVGAVKG